MYWYLLSSVKAENIPQQIVKVDKNVMENFEMKYKSRIAIKTTSLQEIIKHISFQKITHETQQKRKL